MRLKQPFLKLPIRFDADALAAEVRALPPAAWTPHPTGYVGNEAVRLITPNGEPTDAIEGPMAPTPQLQRCNYVREIMAEIGGVWGRSRFMGLAPGREVPPHIDINYYWRTHLRIHIPVITNPGVLFTCGDQTVHMAAGECWVFDSFLTHDVQNKGDAQRIHLVLDTVGGGIVPELMDAAEGGEAEARLFAPGQGSSDGLAFEKVNSPKVMSPWEMRCHLAFIRERSGTDARISSVLDEVERFIDSWAAAWARFGTDDEGRTTYERLLQNIRGSVAALGAATLAMPNGVHVGLMLEQLIFYMALTQRNSPIAKTTKDAEDEGAVTLSGSVAPGRLAVPAADSYRARFDRPIFIVSTPRSGSTLLYETLEQAPGIYSIGNESHGLIESIPGLSPPHRGWSSNRLSALDATAERGELLAESFYKNLKDRDGRSPDGRVRMLEKTPKNALRVAFFDAVWPDSQFVYLYRDVRETLYSMMEAWHSGGFRTYPGLPGWLGTPWSLLLVPGWRSLNGMSLAEIVAHQWAITTETLLNDLEQPEKGRVHAIDYGAFLAGPQLQMERLTAALDLGWDRPLGESLPLSKTTVSTPDPNKWRQIEPVIQSIWPVVEKADARARAFLEARSVSALAAA